MVYEPRLYRTAFRPDDLVSFRVVEGETDLAILARIDLSEVARRVVLEMRRDLASYIALHPEFKTSFEPIVVSLDAPEIVTAMADAGDLFGVGPMAAVAGAIAERVARACAEYSDEVIVENGGDLYLMGSSNRVVALWAGKEGVSRLGIEVTGESLPLAIATSSGRIGHSISFGCADAVAIVAKDGAKADAAATAYANRVHSTEDVAPVIKLTQSAEDVSGAVITIDGAIGAWGTLRLVPTENI